METPRTNPASDPHVESSGKPTTRDKFSPNSSGWNTELLAALKEWNKAQAAIAKAETALAASSTPPRYACLPCSQAAGVVNDPMRHVTHPIGELCPASSTPPSDLPARGVLVEQLRRAHKALDEADRLMASCLTATLAVEDWRKWRRGHQQALADDTPALSQTKDPTLEQQMSALFDSSKASGIDDDHFELLQEISKWADTLRAIRQPFAALSTPPTPGSTDKGN